MKCVLFIILFITFASQHTISQNKNCYSTKPFDKTKVFTRVLNKPHFKGGQDSLVQFLTSNINLQNLVSHISPNEKIYRDTATVKFIVSIEGVLSDLSVSSSKSVFFANEIERLIKKSSCNWIAGGTETLFNVWLQFGVIYSIDRRENGITTTIQIKEYSHVTK